MDNNYEKEVRKPTTNVYFDGFGYRNFPYAPIGCVNPPPIVLNPPYIPVQRPQLHYMNMIQQQQNEDGNPVFPCGACMRAVLDSDDGILCEIGCNRWFHRECTGLLEEAYHKLTDADDAVWVCDQCIRTKSIKARFQNS